MKVEPRVPPVPHFTKQGDDRAAPPRDRRGGRDRGGHGEHLARHQGVAEEGAKKGATFFAEKLIPFFGTALKIGEVIKAVKDVGDAKEALETLEKELTELA